MEATVVSVGKAVLDGALSYAKSKATEEVALQLGVEGDVNFITDELQMMQSFLMTADEERGQNKVLTTWVKQIRDVAYKVEDNLMDFAVHSEKKPFWGCIPRNPCDRRRIAKEVKDIRAKVEDVSNRNLRYHLIKDSSGSKPTTTEEQASIASAAMFGINEARLAAVKQEESKVDLRQLVSSEEDDLRVIAVWGTAGDLGKTSAIQEVYDDPNVSSNFGFRAWIRLMHPFNPKQFIHSLVEQFYENCPDKLEETEKRKTIGINVLMKMESMSQSEMIDVFDTQVSDNTYLIVINDLSKIEEWHCIKRFFSNNKKRSRIIVSTQQLEVASLCTEKPYQASELKQLPSDQTLYLFHKKVICASGSTELAAKNNTTMSTAEIHEQDQQPMNAGEDEVSKLTDGNKFHRSRTMSQVDELFTGRQTEKSKVIELISQSEYKQACKVISVWGMGGLGKTTLVRSVYRSQELSCWKRAWATALRPFNPEVLIRSLASQLLKDDIASGTQKKSTSEMNLQQLQGELSQLLKTQTCLIVVDDISSTLEWELIRNCLGNATRIIVTTRGKNIAKHCSIEDKNMYNLCGLKDNTALDLFKKKVFKNITEKIDLHPDMMEQAKLILKKCDGLPLAISTIGGFLATKPKTATEWRKMNDHISAELDVNPELRTIKTVLVRSYDGLPYHLKSCFLYMSIFPEDYIISRDRLVRRWIAEGYSRDMHGMTAEEVGDRYFDELLDRSMILPREGVDHYSGEIGSCQLHDIMREICISKAREENLVFTLEEGCCLRSTQGPIRHLVISSNWKRDKDVFESMLDLSHVRSLTVFGEWRPYFISDNMRFLRVLDLEDTSRLMGDHLHKIGQFLHLKYLSVHSYKEDFFYLPKSLRNCRHLQTLDAGSSILNKSVCVAPRGIGKLRALHTLSLVDVAQEKGNAIIKELGELTQLRGLGVRGICEKNRKDFWSAIAGHNQLRSLWVGGDDLDCCFGVDDLSAPKFLESLVLRGSLVRATEWIHQLRNLSKLLLVGSQLEQNAIQALGILPNLASLHMSANSYVERELHFQSSSFPSLVVLQLTWLPFLQSLLFEGHTMPKLELLQVDGCDILKEISRLQVLTSLKEIRLSRHYTRDEVKRRVRMQVAEHLKHVCLDTNFDGNPASRS